MGPSVPFASATSTRPTGRGAAIAASEPITSEAWQPVPERSVLAIDADIGVLLASI